MNALLKLTLLLLVLPLFSTRSRNEEIEEEGSGEESVSENAVVGVQDGNVEKMFHSMANTSLDEYENGTKITSIGKTENETSFTEKLPHSPRPILMLENDTDSIADYEESSNNATDFNAYDDSTINDTLRKLKDLRIIPVSLEEKPESSDQKLGLFKNKNVSTEKSTDNNLLIEELSGKMPNLTLPKKLPTKDNESTLRPSRTEIINDDEIDLLVTVPQNETEITTTEVMTTITEPTTCIAERKCYTSGDCFDGRCIGVSAGRCSCSACMSLMKCSSDKDCGGLKGACDLDLKLCNCEKGLRSNGLSIFDALFKFCYVRMCTNVSNSCYGLPCKPGKCMCS